MSEKPLESTHRNPAYELRTLGPFELVERGSKTAVTIQTAKMRAILAYLATAPRQRETRRKLASLLWAGAAEEQARQSLRQLLSNSRKVRAISEVIQFDDTYVSLAPENVSVDLDDFRQSLSGTDTTKLEHAAELYRGDFGVGAELAEPDYDTWLNTERTKLREAAVSTIDRLVRELDEAKRHDAALRHANRLCEIDPLREKSHRLVILQEAAVSGRASAMMRFESFRLLLKEELGVRPEPATLELIDQLRLAPPRASAPPQNEQVAQGASFGERPVPRELRLRPRAVLAMVLCAAFLPFVIVGTRWILQGPPEIAFVGEETGRASLALLPFEGKALANGEDSRLKEAEAETKLAIARNSRLAFVDYPESLTIRDPVSVGRTLHVRYVVKTMATLQDTESVDINLYDARTGVGLWSGPLSFAKVTSSKFSREFVRYIYPEIAMAQAKRLAATESNSTLSLLWRAESMRVRARLAAQDDSTKEVFEAILERDPEQLQALLGLCDFLILRVARDQSPGRARDLEQAEQLALRARELAPNSAETTFALGMIRKLKGHFEQALLDFDRTHYLDRAHWNGAAQSAHVKIFVGKFSEAFQQMETATKHLLPDVGAAETAYMAGETALVSGNADRAVEYLALATNANPSVSRIHALHAAALMLAGRVAEAQSAAATSSKLPMAFTPEMMSRRGGPNASIAYKAERDKYTLAFREALASSRSK